MNIFFACRGNNKRKQIKSLLQSDKATNSDLHSPWQVGKPHQNHITSLFPHWQLSDCHIASGCLSCPNPAPFCPRGTEKKKERNSVAAVRPYLLTWSVCENCIWNSLVDLRSMNSGHVISWLHWCEKSCVPLGPYVYVRTVGSVRFK